MPETAPRRSWVEQVMGLPVSVLARGDGASSAAAEQAVRAVYDELHEVDAVFSPYREDSEVTRLARGQLALADCRDDVREVVRRCREARERTGGLFDAHRPDGRWDPSGLVKGWAVERAARHLEAPATDWCLNAGGDVVVLSPSGVPFAVGIQDPHDGTRVAAVLERTGGGVATSGTAARGAHLYDPRTGAAVRAVASVTVSGPSLETADVLATAAFVGGGLDLVREWTGYEALLIGSDGGLLSTAGWQGTLPA
ncbi:MAG: FAD:protein FMN transferase [Mycobacteriales bacterium]